MTDAVDHSVTGIPSAYDSPREVKIAARCAVVWRYQRDQWTAQELVDVLDALGLT